MTSPSYQLKQVASALQETARDLKRIIAELENDEHAAKRNLKRKQPSPSSSSDDAWITLRTRLPTGGYHQDEIMPRRAYDYLCFLNPRLERLGLPEQSWRFCELTHQIILGDRFETDHTNPMAWYSTHFAGSSTLWRDMLQHTFGIPITEVLREPGAKKPRRETEPTKKKKQKQKEPEDEKSRWIEVRTYIDDDMTAVEVMPRRAYSYLVLENPDYAHRGSLGNIHRFAFNDVKHDVSARPDMQKAEPATWYTLEDGAYDWLWRDLLRDEYEVDIADIVGEKEKSPSVQF
jgi:hypothetical protein